MKIIIIENFFGKRFTYIAEKLSKDHDVECITSSFSHGKKAPKDEIPEGLPYKMTYLPEPGYKKNISLQRFYSHFVWGQNLKKYLETIEEPDVIYCGVPSLTGPNAAAAYCKKKNIRFVIDIQDLWPEQFQIAFNTPVISSIVYAPFNHLANSIYKSADHVCAVSQTYTDRALRVNKTAPGTTVFLGTELDEFDRFSAQEPIIRKDDKSEIWLAYCGLLGNSYDLICVFDALKILKEKNINIRFIVMGDGHRRKEFESYAASKNINVIFTGRLPYDRMCAVLCRCDISVNPIVRHSSGSIINKHSDYAACGLPVVNTQVSEEYRRLVDDYHMGFNCENGNAEDLADKLEVLYNNEQLRKEMGRNSRRCAEELFDKNKTYQKLFDAILNM